MFTPEERSARLAELLAKEHHAMADFLVALAEFDRERAWVKLGHNSLFAYLRRDLHLSAGAAQYRKTAAELVQRYPEVLEALRGGKLCLSSVVQLAKVVTPENVGELLPRFFGLSSREAELVAVSIRPVEDAPQREVITPVRAPGSPSPPALQLRAPEVEVRVAPPAEPQSPAPVTTGPGTAATVATAASRAREVEPLSADDVRFHLAVSKRFLERLQATKDALSHAMPGAASAQALERCMEVFLKQSARRRGIVDRPRKPTSTSTPTSTPTPTLTPTSTPSRYIPADVSRAVWIRDEGKCQWPVASGGVCGSKVRVQIHHQDAWAKHHGPPDPERLMLACAFHQDVAARIDFGDAWMDRFTGGRPRPPYSLTARAARLA